MLIDKFGDNGIVSVVIGRIESDTLHMELWLMSCRVLKRDMEFAMLDELVRHAKKKSIRTIKGYYYRTPKNSMVAELYGTLGFTPDEKHENGDSVWYLDLEGYKNKNKVIMNRISLANILLISAVFAGGFVYVTLLPHETKADDENRLLTKFPKFSIKSYTSGDYTDGIADYFDDTVHARADIKEFIADMLMPLKGMKYGGEKAELYGSGFEKPVTTTTAASNP